MRSRKLKANYMARTWYALNHHASPLKEPFCVLLGIASSKGFLWKSWKGGQNSNYFYRADRKYFLKGILRPDPGIEIRRMVRGPVIAKVKNERDAWRIGDML